MDAAGHLGLHQRPDVLVLDHALAFGEAGNGPPIAHGQVLQLAFAALVADGAVQRMVDQEEFHHAVLRVDRTARSGVNLHPVHHGRRAGRDRLGHFLHVDQTHPAIGRDGEFRVIAESRNLDAGAVGCLDDHRALRRLHGLAVNLDVDHFHGAFHLSAHAASPCFSATIERPCST
jgi:hypothetical protein